VRNLVDLSLLFQYLAEIERSSHTSGVGNKDVDINSSIREVREAVSKVCCKTKS
jgi:hypothetical protein